MTIIILGSALTIVSIVLLGVIYFYMLQSSKYKLISGKFEQSKIDHAIFSQDLKEYKDKCNKLEAEHGELLVAKTSAETKMQSLQEELQNANSKYTEAIREKEQAIEVRNEYQRKQELALQRVQTIEDEMKNWEKIKEEHERNLKASTMEVANKISSKLLDDHKRETENAKKESEKLVKQTTEGITEQYKGIIESVSSLQEGVKKSEVVHRALLSPSGAGSLGEITLENIFKNSGLINGQDYKMQFSVSSESGKGLRPDAVVFLPDNNVMVIDSKASKFFLELGGEDISSDKAKEINANLKRSMNENLKGLASREYSKAIEEQAGKSLARVYMFLPTEAALDKLRKVDPQFIEKAWGQGICPVGPTGLLNELLRASMIISNAKQEENSKVIISKVKDLLDSIATLNGHANKVGKGLKSAIDNYDRFCASFNSNFMSKSKAITRLGVDSNKFKSIEPLTQYKVTSLDYKSIEASYSEEDDNVQTDTTSLELVKN